MGTLLSGTKEFSEVNSELVQRNFRIASDKSVKEVRKIKKK